MVLHSVKDPDAVARFMEARRAFLADNPNTLSQVTPPGRVGGIRHESHGLGQGHGIGQWRQPDLSRAERARNTKTLRQQIYAMQQSRGHMA